MKAAVIRQHGDVEQIRVEDRPRPHPRRGQALLEVKAAALNHLDIWVRMGGRSPEPMPHVLGSDAAGVVAELGEEAQGLSIGQEVVLNPGLSCGLCEFCLAGQTSQCASFGIVGLTGPGTFAQFVAVPAANLRPKPAHLDFRQAAALSLAHLTAWRMLISRGRCLPGQTVLIHGIGGGVALAALQLAKAAGARTIVTSSSDDKLARAAELGADHGINYRTADVAQGVRDFTAGRGVDLVIDSVGAGTLPTSLACLRKGGRVVLCGVTGGAQVHVNLQAVYWNQLEIVGSTMGTQEEHRQLLQAVEASHLAPVIDSVRPLTEIHEATRRMETGGQFGKIVLET